MSTSPTPEQTRAIIAAAWARAQVAKPQSRKQTVRSADAVWGLAPLPPAAARRDRDRKATAIGRRAYA